MTVGSGALSKSLPSGLRPFLRRVIDAARARNAALYLVGGPVRDLLLGRPIRDVDLVVDAVDAAGVASLARAAAFPGSRTIRHDRFGTVQLETGVAGAGLDLGMARREIYAHPGALPGVEPAGIEEDLARRDFSVNALAMPLTPAARKGHSALIDLHGGLADLEKRSLRILHPKSFHDDPTRALRAGRLAARLGFRMVTGSRNALRNALRDGAIGRVSGDRLRREIEKIFEEVSQEAEPLAALRLLHDWHVLPALEPGLELPRSARSPLRRFGKFLVEPQWESDAYRPWAVGLAVWLAPLPAALRRRALRRFSVRGAAASRLAELPTSRDRALRQLEKARGRGGVDAALGELSDEELVAVFVWAPPATRRKILRYAAQDRGRRPPIDGRDLVAVGLHGADVAKALARIRSAYLDGLVADRPAALALARELAQRRRGRARNARKRGKVGRD